MLVGFEIDVPTTIKEEVEVAVAAPDLVQTQAIMDAIEELPGPPGEVYVLAPPDLKVDESVVGATHSPTVRRLPTPSPTILATEQRNLPDNKLTTEPTPVTAWKNSLGLDARRGSSTLDIGLDARRL